MGDRDQPERIEVELFTAAGEVAPAFGRPDVAETGPAPDPERQRSVGPRVLALLVTAAVVLVVVLIVVLVVVPGRGDESSGSAGTAESARSTGSTADVADVRGGGTSPPRDVPIPPVTPRLGDAEPLTVEVVGLPAPLSGRPIEIVAFGNGGILSRLDLTEGRLLSQRVQRHAFGRARLFLGDDWIVMPSPEADTPSLVVDRVGEVDLVDFEADVVAVTDDGEIWLVPWARSQAVGSGSLSLQAVAVDGSEIASMEVPSRPVGADPVRGFVVASDDGWLDVDTKATGRLTAGELLALGDDLALARECGRADRCDIVEIVRSSGERRVVEPSSEEVPDPELGFVRTESIGPGGVHAIVELRNPVDRSSTQPTLAVIELATGQLVQVGPVQDIAQSAWTPDGRFVVHNAGGRIMVFDTTTASSFVVTDRLIAIDAFAVRPAPPPADEP